MNSQNPDRARWNKKYSQKGIENWESRPSEWLCSHQSVLQSQERGPALDVACGNGRNSFLLAAMGFEIEAVDISDVAICWLQQQVSKKNVSIQPLQMDFENDLLAKEKYQIVLCFNYLERSLFPALKDALLPGGLLFFETVYRDDVTILASAMNPRYVLDYNELLHAFSDLRILEYREKIIYAADQGKKKALASMVARKN